MERVKKRKDRKARNEKYSKLAKEQCYRSKSAYKLMQLDSKFRFLHSSRSVLDLGAAPGAWLQVCVERVPAGSLVVGVDLYKIVPVRGAVALQADITDSKCSSAVRRVMAEYGCSAFDLVLHDGAVDVGSPEEMAAMQCKLVVDAVKLATQLLAPKGKFVTKLCRNQNYVAVLNCLKQLFEKVEGHKPDASKLEADETFLVCFNYKAPSKICFNYKASPKIVDAPRGTKQKRQRDGYENGDTTSRKSSSAFEFIRSESPIDFLDSVASITFDDPDSLPLKNHALTTEKIKSICDDVGLLRKEEFQYILKWRLAMRKALSPLKATAENEVEDERECDLSNPKKKRAKKIVDRREGKVGKQKGKGKKNC